MTIFIDADACPVVKQTEAIARRHGLPMVILCDTNHVLQATYAEVITVGAGKDAVDLALINRCIQGDIVVTQNYGVAAMALARGCFPLHQSGMRYTEHNIDQLLQQRHEGQKARRAKGKHHLKGPKKRTEADNIAFCTALEALIAEQQNTK